MISIRPKIAISATTAQIVKLPVSPQNIFAGYLLNQKKANKLLKSKMDITNPGKVTIHLK